jgi:hypothetical protein
MLYIWWTNQKDFEAAAKQALFLPDHIKDQFNSRYGQNGRGRLWFCEGVKREKIDWNPPAEIEPYLNDAGGIMFEDCVELIKEFPGIITDVHLNRIK